jgi:hypothetical protein
MTIEERERQKRAERLVNYENRTNDMREIKSQQWLIVYYCLLLNGGIIGITNVVKDINEVVIFFLAILSYFIALFSCFAIFNNQRILSLDRIETLEIETTFFTKLEYHKAKIDPLYVTYWFHWQYWLAFKLSVVGGSAFTVWYLCNRICLSNTVGSILKILFHYRWLFLSIWITISALLSFFILYIQKSARNKFNNIHFYDHHYKDRSN